ncbi:hypothetical protein Tco_1315294 [Tanacetum coccineum]
MGRDTIQLEGAVSTISEEYLLEFTTEYGILENLHPEVPGLGETIVDFPEGKTIGKYITTVHRETPQKSNRCPPLSSESVDPDRDPEAIRDADRIALSVYERDPKRGCTVNLIVGADPTIGLRRESKYMVFGSNRVLSLGISCEDTAAADSELAAATLIHGPEAHYQLPRP